MNFKKKDSRIEKTKIDLVTKAPNQQERKGNLKSAVDEKDIDSQRHPEEQNVDYKKNLNASPRDQRV